MTLLETALEAVGKAKIRDVIKYDLDGSSPFFDYIILGTMSSVNQGMGALSYLEDLIKMIMKKKIHSMKKVKQVQ